MTTNSVELLEEKDNFWFIVGGIVAAAVIIVVLVKSSEHGKYVTTANAIAESTNYVAHKSENK
jgi:hypothetical protein